MKPLKDEKDRTVETKNATLLSKESIREKIFDALGELGVNFSDKEKTSAQDFDLSEYVQESIQLILFALALEENVGLELTDDIFVTDNLRSIDALVDILLQSINTQ